MDKWTIARTLDEIAKYIELSDPNPFRVRAFEKAARAIEKLDQDIEQLVRDDQLLTVPGIGKAIGPIVSELVTTGGSRYLEELREQYPPGIFELLRIPTLGLKKIGILHATLGISNLEELEAAAHDGRIAKLKGFGAKTQEKILENIATAKSRTSQFLLPVGIETGESIREQLAAIDEISDAEVTGSVRRRLEVVRNVNIAIAAKDPERAIAAIRKRGVIDRIEEVDELTLRGVARDEIEVLLHLSKPDDFGATVLRTTGSKEFVEAFGKLPKAKTEHDVFERAAVPFVDPELREDASALAKKKRVKLIEPTDLRGTFHIHTTFSDGRNSVLEMLSAARDRGWEYAGLSDHSKNAFYARGLTEEDLKRQHAEIRTQEKVVEPMRVFRGTEADILNDGAIDYGHKTLPMFDFVVASVHSRFGMEKDEMTARLLRALDDPFVTFLGHLTGRLLLSRQGYTFDFDKILDRAAERGVIIEINGSPRRLELDWRQIRRAVDRGVVLSIHPDAHSTRELTYVISGTWVARKGGLSAKHLFNTRPVDEVAEYLAERRKKAIHKTKGAA
ncbi:MAG TPA: PHP domain-containing protein [Thermoanaerobaculia bacterium]|jgi:DNA polymerase (family 10)